MHTSQYPQLQRYEVWNGSNVYTHDNTWCTRFDTKPNRMIQFSRIWCRFSALNRILIVATMFIVLPSWRFVDLVEWLFLLCHFCMNIFWCCIFILDVITKHRMTCCWRKKQTFTPITVIFMMVFSLCFFIRISYSTRGITCVWPTNYIFWRQQRGCKNN